MKKQIKLDAREWDMGEKISELCSRLSRVPFKNWSYRERTRVHDDSEEKIEEGTFSLRQEQVSYILSKSYIKSEYHMTGACPIFGDGGYWVWNHYFSHSLRVSPQGQAAILIEESYTDDDPIVSFYDELDGERIKLKQEKEEKTTRQREEKESKRRKKLQQAGKKILRGLLKKK